MQTCQVCRQSTTCQSQCSTLYAINSALSPAWVVYRLYGLTALNAIFVLLFPEYTRASVMWCIAESRLNKSYTMELHCFFDTSCANVAATSIGNTSVASAKTLTDSAPARILPQDTASSGCAPESDPSNSCPVLMNTE